MTPIRRFGAVDFVLFLYVVLLAGGVRAGYLALCADNAHNSGSLIVQDRADEPDLLALVHSVKDNNAFTSAAPLSDGPEETAHASPGYPWRWGCSPGTYRRTSSIPPSAGFSASSAP